MRNSVVKQSLYAKNRSKDDTFEMMRCLVGKFDALAHLVLSWHAGLPTLNPDAEEFIPLSVYEANEDLEDLDDQAFLMKHEAKFRLSSFAPIEGILMKTLKTTKSEASKEEAPKRPSVYVLGAKTAEEEDELLQQEKDFLSASAAPPRMYADLADFMKVHNLPRYVLGAKTESEEDELLQQEAHELEEAAEEEDVLLQQEMHDLEEEEDEKWPQQDSASEEEPMPILPS